MDKKPENTLAANLRWLMDNTAGLDSQEKVAEQAKKIPGAKKIDQRTVGRALNASHASSLDTITAIALAFKVEAWQLIAPRLGADFYKIDKDRRVVPVQERAPSVSEADALERIVERRLASGEPPVSKRKSGETDHDGPSLRRVRKSAS